MPEAFRVPLERASSEIVIKKSRFLTTVFRASTAQEARAGIAELRGSLPGANHHVYAFRAGFGNSVTEGMSDAGEPSGTAGPPTLAVLRGSGVGDIALVTARYFGGTKLGTGGLVRAYTESAQEALRQLKTELKIERRVIGLETPYSLYKPVARLIEAHGGEIEDTDFGVAALIIARFAVDDLAEFQLALTERTAGSVAPVTLS